MARSPIFTRRGLFRGVGTATLAVGCGPSGKSRGPGQVDSGETKLGEIGPGPAPLELRVNGKAMALDVEPRTTLLEALRTDLDITGSKMVCDRGACGACVVHVDGVPKNACMMLAHDAAGREVTTIEGLGENSGLNRLQQAFIRHDALQCGFCTSGMIMSAAALLARHDGKTRLTEGDVKRALAGNLCRCGTYPNVVAAVLDAGGSTTEGAG